MRRDPRELIAAAIRCSRTPKVVGAGIGCRHAGDSGHGEPSLTILTRGPMSIGEVRSAFAREKGFDLLVDVLDVGDVVALAKLDSNRS